MTGGGYEMDRVLDRNGASGVKFVPVELPLTTPVSNGSDDAAIAVYSSVYRRGLHTAVYTLNPELMLS